MPVSREFREFVLEQFAAVTPVTSRAMFGAVGVYANGLFFALIDDDVVYLKADDASRADFLAAGSKPFAPYGDDQYSMNYYELPAEALEDEEALAMWMRKALDAAARKTKKKRAPRTK
jgi:DNA transformation protein